MSTSSDGTPQAGRIAGNRVRVLLCQHGLSVFDYKMPEGEALQPGDVVRVPLGPRQVPGVVWDADAFAVQEVAENRLRPVAARLPVPPLPEATRKLVAWTSRYYMAPAGAVLRMVLSVSDALEEAKTILEYRVADPLPDVPLTRKRLEALELLSGKQGTVRDLSKTGVTESMIRTLVSAGCLRPVPVAADAPVPQPEPDFAQPVLSAEQAAAADELRRPVEEGRFAPLLLEGVTGSGKTEVYFEAVAEALRKGGQVLVLLPEIALTEPWLNRFKARFGCLPTAWHSDLSQKERRRAWRAAASGEAKVVVGARSALFLPYPDLKLIVVDEEHETTFKQEEGVLYQARDVAVMRGSLEGCPVILASATPALETRLNAESGKYAHIRLPDRFGGASMPAIASLDLRRTPPERGRWLCEPLHKQVVETLERGEQVLLFLNRRGYAPLTLCRTCGERITCPMCSAWLVEHKLTGRLHCHHCGFATPIPANCPSCGAADSLVACGPGVERVAEEVERVLPEAKVAVVTSDTVYSPAKAAAFVESVETGAVNVLVGTQILAKGYHFPNLTLVGVVDADLGLAGGDLRAAERTFQQITQVAGRAGRGSKPGKVVLQTYQPEAPVLKALVAGDIEGFYRAEAAARERHGMPPFGRLAALILSGPDLSAVNDTAQSLARAAPRVTGLEVLGPAPAPLAMLRGRHRMRFLIKARKGMPLQTILNEWLGRVRWPCSVRVTPDIDPQSFL
ncbi:primosomal protein N' [Pedomonas mirosovicensis]|uniref:primosomal protein N' n=1 Tax=Pedomonas mirosovicensis TaxID=2908641 RepID=UPI002169DA33|nr:primosomal protein N' [Pedomonas mirosovicensis]